MERLFEMASEALANAGYEYLPDQNGEFKEVISITSSTPMSVGFC